MLTKLEKLHHHGFKYLCCGQGGLSGLFSHMEHHVSIVYACVSVCGCVVAFVFIQAPDVYVLHCRSSVPLFLFFTFYPRFLFSSTFTSCCLILLFTNFSPGGNHEWPDTNGSNFALCYAQTGKVSQRWEKEKRIPLLLFPLSSPLWAGERWRSHLVTS